jgi:glutaminase
MQPSEVSRASPIQQYLEAVWGELADLRDGEVASYIPELSHARPEWFGIAVATVDGHVYQAGDSRQGFTVQSISKALTYGIALEDRGLDFVLAKVGVEPSGEAFNSISLEPGTGRPLNPMINAGAIATTGLIQEGTRNRLERILDAFARYTGHPHAVDESVYASEKATGHRNRAIAHLLFGHGILEREPEDILDLYFKQCSILVTARDLASIGACLANGGVNPITGVVALQGRYVPKVLSVMSSCGMYDYSGAWVYNVGMPAKSGVGGGIMAVLPGQFGLGVFSPPLDQKGNSVRGIATCKRLAADFKLHLFDVVRSTSSSVLRLQYDARDVRSRRARTPREVEVLDRQGGAIRVYELQGEMRFGATESVLQQLSGDLDGVDFVILDMRRVFEVDHASTEMLAAFADTLRGLEKQLLFTETDAHYPFRRRLTKRAEGSAAESLFRFADTDRALEWCEDRLIGRESPGALTHPAVPDLRDHYLCQGLTRAEVGHLQEIVRPVVFEAGETLFRAGDDAGSLFFLVDGEVDVVVRTASGHERRLATLTPGMSFGEVAMLNERRRSAEVVAVSAAKCYELFFEDLDDSVRTKLVTNLAIYLSRKLARDNRQMQRLE